MNLEDLSAKMALDERARRAISESIHGLDSKPPKLSRDQQRLLDVYFWNRVFSCRRDAVPCSVIHFMECVRLTADRYSAPASAIIDAWLMGLCYKGYLKKGPKADRDPEFLLDVRGIEYLAQVHRPILGQLHRIAISYLKLWQLIGVGVGIVVALLTFVGHIRHWFQ